MITRHVHAMVLAAMGACAAAGGCHGVGNPSGDGVPERAGERRVSGGFPPIRRADLRAEVTVLASERVVIGGEQESSMYVDVRNTGESPVRVSWRRAEEDVTIATLEPGDSASRRFEAGEAVVMTNLSSSETSSVLVRIWGASALGVAREEAGATP